MELCACVCVRECVCVCERERERVVYVRWQLCVRSDEFVGVWIIEGKLPVFWVDIMGWLPLIAVTLSWFCSFLSLCWRWRMTSFFWWTRAVITANLTHTHTHTNTYIYTYITYLYTHTHTEKHSHVCTHLPALQTRVHLVIWGQAQWRWAAEFKNEKEEDTSLELKWCGATLLVRCV